jgi:DUF4097 and DUF4098 domain-containing protein YvlB
MRLAIAVCIVIAVMALAACDLEDLIAARVESSIVQTADFATVGTPSFDIESSNGAVNVRGVPGQLDVQVTATLRSRGETLAEANDRASRIVVQMTQNGDRISLRYSAAEQDSDVRKYSGVQFDVTTPVASDVDARTSNGAIAASTLQGILRLRSSNGQIVIDHFTGEGHAETSNGQVIVQQAEGVFRLDTSNGAILMSGLVALVDAETSNGQISFSGTLVAGSHRMRSSNGRLSVQVPAASAIALHASTSNATISSDLPWTGDTSGASWSATLNAPTMVDLTLSTSNGSIRIEALL